MPAQLRFVNVLLQWYRYPFFTVPKSQSGSLSFRFSAKALVASRPIIDFRPVDRDRVPVDPATSVARDSVMRGMAPADRRRTPKLANGSPTHRARLIAGGVKR